jgi:hypothetical protein
MKRAATTKITELVLNINLDASLEEQIAKRAYELWHQGGRKPNSDLSNWLQAEREINEWHQKRHDKD